jgi:DEAD/DEAH box helicase domain-containing protein
MDLENGVIYLKKEQTDFYTDALAIETIWIEKTIRGKKLRHIDVYFGEVVVEEVIRGFVKKQFFTDRKIETCPLDLPKIEFKTKAMWFTIEDSIVNKIKSVEDLPGSIHALEHALVGMLPIIVQCDRKDIGGVSHPKHPDTNLTSIFLYDGVEGGICITEKAFERVEDLLNITFKSISSCPCKEGCPSCIYSPKCGNENKPLSKNGSILLLKEILS